MDLLIKNLNSKQISEVIDYDNNPSNSYGNWNFWIFPISIIRYVDNIVKMSIADDNN